MEGDDLLRQLGRHVRDQMNPALADDPIWERLARGELPPSEEAQLREQAAVDPEIATLYEAYRPFDDAAKKRVAARVAANLYAPRAVRWRRVAFIAGPLAAAAAIALVVSLRPSPAGALADIPEYSLTLSGGDRATRSATPDQGGPVELHRNSRIEVVLRPAISVKHPVAVRAYLVQGKSGRLWNVPMDRSADGAVRISGEVGALLGDIAAGSWALAFTVSPEGSTEPAPGDVARAALGEGGPFPFLLLDTQVRILDGS
jgi:hypothetical protein